MMIYQIILQQRPLDYTQMPLAITSVIPIFKPKAHVYIVSKNLGPLNHFICASSKHHHIN